MHPHFLFVIVQKLRNGGEYDNKSGYTDID